MISGGNSALKEFTDHYEITLMPIESKYITKAMHLYRRMLTEITLGRNFDEELLTIEEGKSLFEKEEESG